MPSAYWYRSGFLAVALAAVAFPQIPNFDPSRRPPGNSNLPGQRPPQPGAPPAGTTPTTSLPAPTGPPANYGGVNLNNVSVTEVIDLLSRQLKLNYILDPRVKGGV